MMRSVLPVVSLFALIAAAPAPDPLLDKLVTGARAVSPSTLTFGRSARTVTQEKDGTSSSRVRVDRWDGKQMVLVSIDGKPPTPDDIAAFRKATTGRPVSGYHRLADFLKAGAVRVNDPQGRTVYRINGLPKGSVNIGKDISGNLIGEATVDTGGPQPYVTRFRTYLAKPLSIFMIAKLDQFEHVSDYRIGGDGRPAQVRSVQSMAGSQFGKAGTTRTEANYTVGR